MNKKILLTIVATVIIGSGIYYYYQWQKAGFEKLSDKLACESTGGKWDYIICNHPGCKPNYFCNCEIGSKNERNGDIFFSTSRTFRLNDFEKNDLDLKNKKCKICENDNDCGKNICDLNGNQCESGIFKCENGICKNNTERWGNYSSEEVYDCVQSQCKLITKFAADTLKNELSNIYYKKGNIYVYFNGVRIKDADIATFTIIGDKDSKLAKDKLHVYDAGQIVSDANPDTSKP